MNRFVAEWITNTLEVCCHCHASPLEHFGIDQKTLSEDGLKDVSQKRFYQSLYVYSTGIHELLKDISPPGRNNTRFVQKFWRVFTKLLELSDLENIESVLKQFGEQNDQAVEAILESHKCALENMTKNCETIRAEDFSAKVELIAETTEILLHKKSLSDQLKREVQLNLELQSRCNAEYEMKKSFQDALLAAEKVNSELTKERQDLEIEMTKLKTQNEDGSKQLVSLQNLIDEAYGDRANLVCERDSYEAEIAYNRRKCEAEKRVNDELEGKLFRALEDIDILKQQNDEIMSQLVNVDRAKLELQVELSAAKESVQELSEKVDIEKKRKDLFLESVDSAQYIMSDETTFYSDLLDHIESLKSSIYNSEKNEGLLKCQVVDLNESTTRNSISLNLLGELWLQSSATNRRLVLESAEGAKSFSQQLQERDTLIQQNSVKCEGLLLQIQHLQLELKCAEEALIVKTSEVENERRTVAEFSAMLSTESCNLSKSIQQVSCLSVAMEASKIDEANFRSKITEVENELLFAKNAVCGYENWLGVLSGFYELVSNCLDDLKNSCFDADDDAIDNEEGGFIYAILQFRNNLASSSFSKSGANGISEVFNRLISVREALLHSKKISKRIPLLENQLNKANKELSSYRLLVEKQRRKCNISSMTCFNEISDEASEISDVQAKCEIVSPEVSSPQLLQPQVMDKSCSVNFVATELENLKTRIMVDQYRANELETRCENQEITINSLNSRIANLNSSIKELHLRLIKPILCDAACQIGFPINQLFSSSTQTEAIQPLLEDEGIADTRKAVPESTEQDDGCFDLILPPYDCFPALVGWKAKREFFSTTRLVKSTQWMESEVFTPVVPSGCATSSSHSTLRRNRKLSEIEK